MFALRTTIVRLQRINFGNIKHSRNNRTANTTTRTNKVTTVKGVFNQFVSDVIQNGEAVTDDGIKFHFQTVFYQLGQGITVPFVGFFVSHITNRILRARDGGRIKLVRIRYGFKAFYHICNFVGIGYAYFVSNIFAQVSELCQHFFRSAVVKRRLIFIFAVLTPRVLQYSTIFFIFRI